MINYVAGGDKSDRWRLLCWQILFCGTLRARLLYGEQTNNHELCVEQDQQNNLQQTFEKYKFGMRRDRTDSELEAMHITKQCKC